jgi:hypothetical protein
MHRLLVFTGVFLLLLSQAFAQQNSEFRTVGRIPSENDRRLYKLQVGFFRDMQSVERVSQRLADVFLPATLENEDEYTRVSVSGLRAADLPDFLEIIKTAGFYTAFISVDTLSK